MKLQPPSSIDLPVFMLRLLRRRAGFVAVPAALALGLLPVAQAATYDWDPGVGGGGTSGVTLGGSGTWDNGLTTSWWDSVGSTQVLWNSAAGDTARFGGLTSGGVTLGTGINAHGLVFNTSGYILSGSTLTLDDPNFTGVTPNITVNIGTATINNTVQGVNGLMVDGAGILSLGGTNTFTGGTAITNGTVNAGNVSALSSGDVVVSANGTLASTGAAGNWATNVRLNGNGKFSQTQNGILGMATGKAITITGTGNTLDVSGAAGGSGTKILLSVQDQLTGSGTFTKTGGGTLQLGQLNPLFTGNAIINAGFVEIQHIQGLGMTPNPITVGGTGELVVSAFNYQAPIIANAGGAVSGDNGNVTLSGAVTANGNFFARARDFYSTGVGRNLTLSGAITGAGNLIAQGPTAGTGRVIISGANATTWTGGVQVDPNTIVNATVGFGTGANSVGSLGSGALTLNGGRLTLTPTVGTVTTTAGIAGRFISLGTNAINSTFAAPWFTATASANRTDLTIDQPNMAQINPVNGLPGAWTGYTAVPQGIGQAATTAFLEGYGVVYNGLVTITNPGSYTFSLPSDDGGSVFVDGVQIVTNEGGHAVSTIGAGVVTLSAGAHQITVKNVNGGTGGGYQLAYQGPDQLIVPTIGTVVAANNTGGVITNMNVVGVAALSNVAGGLVYPMTNNISATAASILETSGFDTTSAGTMTLGANVTFNSATGHTFTQNGPVTLSVGGGITSASSAVTVPITTTLAPSNVIVNGAVTLTGNATLNAEGGLINSPLGLVTVNGVIDDGASTFGITKNGGGGTVILGGTSANTFKGAFNMAQGLLLLNKTAGQNAIGLGGLNLDTSIATGTTAIDYAVVRLMANEQIDNNSTLNVLTNNSAGYGATLDLNSFTETVGAVNVRGATTNMGRIVTGPTGKLIVGGNINFDNNRNAAGNTGREALITSVAPASNAVNITTYGGGTLDLGGATRTITTNSSVSQLSNDGTIDTIITNGGIIKAGGQRLTLNGSNPTTGSNSTFASGLVLNDGILRAGGGAGPTSSVLGVGTLTINKGLTTVSGGIVAGGATLELRNNGPVLNTNIGGTVGAVLVGQSVTNVTNYGNAVTVANTVPIFGIDVNNTPQVLTNALGTTLSTIIGSGTEMRLGTLTTTAALQLNVTGGNNDSVAFNGINLGGALTVNGTTGNLRLNNLSGSNSISTIAGSTGSLIIGGNGSGFTGALNLSAAGTLRLAPAVGASNNQLGGATLTLAANPIIGIAPVLEGGSLTAGTPGGLSAKFYQLSGIVAMNATNFGQTPSGVLSVPTISDGAITNRPPTVTSTALTNGMAVYSGLLNITNGGSYTFQSYVDDGSQLVVDGVAIISINTGAASSGVVHTPVSIPMTLAAGLHTIAFKVINGGGGGGAQVSFNGPDSGGVMRPIPATALQTPTAYSNVANSGLNQSIAGAGSLTLDGGGTDLDGGINNLTIAGATGTLNVTNAGGIGAITVSGTTAVGANTATLNPTTGALALLGDVTGNGIISKTGGGLLVLAGAKTFTGAINVSAGGLQITDPASLGTAAGATSISGTGVLDLNGVALGLEPLNIGGLGTAAGAGISGAAASIWNSSTQAASASGPITLTANTAIGGLGNITLTGAQTGNFTLQKVGPNTLTLSGASTNTAAYTVSAGFLKVNNAAALGTTAGNTIVSSGAVLDLNGFSLAEPLNISGAGTSNYGSINSLASLINSGSAVTQSGAVTLGASASVGSSSLGAGGDMTFSTAFAGAQNFTKVGGNTVTITAANTTINATNVNTGTLVLSGAGTSSGGNWTINPTGIASLDNTTTATSNRLGARVINLVGGNLNIVGFNGVTAVSEALGANALNFSSNRSVLTLTPSATLGNGGVSLSSTASIARVNNGTGLIRGTGLGTAAAGTANIANVALTGASTPLGQPGADGSKNRAIIPWVVMDTNAAGDGSSFVKVGTNGVMALAASEYDTDSFTAGINNIQQTTIGALNAPVGTTLVNSLTLSGTGGINIGSGNTLQVDSGGILATASTSITGGNLQFGNSAGVILREILAYTSGAGTNLNITSVIGSTVAGYNAYGPNTNPNIVTSGNAGRPGLTKDGLGTLTLGAQNTFLGSVRINGGSLVLNGGNNTIYFPVPAAPVAGALTGTLNSANLIVNAGGTLDLNGTNQRVGSLASNMAGGSTALPTQNGFITNNSTATDSTLYTTQGVSFTASTSLNHSAVVGAKNLNWQRDGGFTLTLTAPNTYKGATTINGGLTILQDGATLAGTSAITINRASLRIDDSQTIQTLNRIPNTIPITLNGGSIAFIGRGGGTQNVINLANGVGGSLTIGSGPALIQGTMSGSVSANGAGDLRVNVGNIIRSTGSGTLSFNYVQQGNQNMGDNPRYFLSQLNGLALPAAGSTMLPAWLTVGGYNPASAQGGTSGSINNITVNTTDFAQYDPTTGLRPVFYTSVLAPGNNVMIGQTTTLPIGNTVINALRFDGASTIIYGDAGYDTLNLQSGGLLSTLNANNRTLGIERNAGKLTAGGVNPGTPQELYIYNSASTLTINASIVNNPDGSVVTPIFGGASIGGTISLNGTNTYTGTTYVNGVNLVLNNTVGVAVPGNIIASGGTSNGADSQAAGSQTISLNASNQIAPTATVTLNGGTALNLNGNTNTLANLVFAADGGSNGNQGPSVSTGSGSLTLTGNITATNLQQAITIPVMQGNLALAAGSHNINVGTFPGAPGAVGFTLNSTLSGAGPIDKSGAGIMGLGSTSPGYTAALGVSLGGLQFTTNNTSIGSTITLAGGTNLSAGGFFGSIGGLSGTGTVNSIFGTQAQSGGQVNVGLGGVTSSFPGQVTGVVAMGKVGAGDFTLTNPANDYSGGTFVNGGTFTLAGAGVNATGSGILTVNNTGTLVGAGNVTNSLRFNGGSGLNEVLPGAPGAAPITTLASVSTSGFATINLTGSPSVGVYPLIDYSGAALTTGALAGFKLGTTPGGGLLYGLVHDAAGTSLNVSVENVNASQTWTGFTDGVWDNATNNWGGTYTASNQVVFTNAGLRKTITGGPQTPQAITITNSGLCNDYSIANNLGGALAGGLSKNGIGLLQLTGNNTFTGPITVGGGTVRASVSTATNSLGGSSVSLTTGTTLQLDPVANTSTTGFTGRYFNQPSNANTLGNMHFQLPAVATQTDPGVPNVIWNSTNRPANGQVGFQVGTGWESFATQWVGKLNVPATGPYSFFTNSDDATRVFIDGIQINNNDGGKGNLEVGGNAFLATGLHDVRFEFIQGTGGAQAGLSWQGPGIAKANIPAAALFTAENVAGGYADNNINVGNNLSVTGNANVNLNGSQFTAVQLGSLTLANASTLNVSANAGKLLRAGSTNITGTVTINTSADISLGTLTDAGTVATIIKKGIGRWVLDNTNPLSTGQASVLTAGTTLDIQAGKLAVIGQNSATLPLNSTNPVGAATIKLNGGNLSLETKQGVLNLDTPITVFQNALIEQQAASANTFTLGSNTNGIAINSGSTLTFDLFGGTRGTTNQNNQNANVLTAAASLSLNGVISGTGNLNFRSTQTNYGNYPVWGTPTLNANNNVAGTATFNGGYAFQGVANTMIATINSNGRLSNNTAVFLNQAQLTLDDSATVNTGRLNATTATPVTLRAGTLNLLMSTAVSSGETIAALTIDSGVNRVALQNTPAASTTGLLTAASLVRNNRGFVQFQGSVLGGQATAAGLVKFTSALSGQLLGGVGAAATSTISVLPYAVGASNPAGTPPTYMPVTYDATNGVRPINTTTEITTLAAALTNSNTRDAITASVTPVPTVNAINSWTLDYNSGTAGFTTTITTNPVLYSGTGAGLLLLTAGNATQQPHTIASALATGINFQGAEGHIVVTNTAGATISAVIGGTNGITVSGNNNINTNALQAASTFGGTLTLSGTNTYTGTTTINGRLVINSGTGDTPLGNAANPVQFGGGTLVFNNTGSTLAATRTVTMLPNTFGVIDTNTFPQTIAGPVTGSGGLVKINTGRLTLNNTANNYSGPTTVYQGDLTTTTGPQGNILLSTAGNLTFNQTTSGAYTGNISGLGSVTITANAANVITLGDPNDVSKGVNTYGGGTTFGNANAVTLRGTTSSLVGGIVTQAGGIVTEQNFDGVAANVISGPATFLKLGNGKVTVANASSYNGSTTISAGSLIAGTDSLTGTNGAFGNSAGAIVLGDAATTTNNSSPGIYTGGSVTISRPITVANQATSGTYIIGGAVDANSTLSGAISLNQNVKISQVFTTLTNNLNLTGGISSANAGAKTIEFTGPGKSTVATIGISDGSGTVTTTVSGGLTTLSAASTYTGATNITGGTLMLGANNVLPDTTPLNLSTGATLNTGGFSDTTGFLSVNGNAILDTAQGTGSLTFSDVNTWTGILSIWNYTGAPWTPGTDKLIFTNTANVNVANVQFYSDNGLTVIGTGGGGILGNELVPVPEASGVFSALGLLGLLGYRERRRFLHYRN